MSSTMDGHRQFRPTIGDRLTRSVISAAGSLPPTIMALLAGRPTRIDGQKLDPHVQVGIKAIAMRSDGEKKDASVAHNRHDIERQAFTVGGRPLPLPKVTDLTIAVPGADLAARLYSPVTDERELPLLVYFHGGGWVLGSIDSHDSVCRHLAREGEIRVLSVDYRMAPEHPFPTAVDDAYGAVEWVYENTKQLHADPTKIAVGGDSAGANLATVVCQQRRNTGEQQLAFQLLFVPAVDMSTRRPSFHLFGQGLSLTAADIDYYETTYLPSDEDRTDVRASPLLAEDLTGMPATYIAVAGFDPLRDEGEEYAHRLAQAGVPVSVRRHATMVHPFVNSVGASQYARHAVSEAVGALRMGLRH